MTRFGDPEPLAAQHVLESFDCGNAPLNVWLVKHAHQAAAGGSARTYVAADTEQRVVGYHALAATGVDHRQATARGPRPAAAPDPGRAPCAARRRHLGPAAGSRRLASA